MYIVNGISVRLLNNNRSNARWYDEGTTKKMKQKNRGCNENCRKFNSPKKAKKRNEKMKIMMNQGKKKKNHKGFYKKSSKNEGKEKACEASNNGGSEKRIVTNFLFHDEERERKN